MKTELINLLLKAEIVKNNEVERALHYESGSSLVERLLSLGYGNEEDVFKIIKNKLKLAVVVSESFKNIEKKVIDIIPREIVEKHHILPFYADETTVHVAMFDPTQDPCLNEMCFFTNLKVVPYGALASQITMALNKYYGLSLPETFRHGKETIDPKYKGPEIPVIKQEESSPLTKLPPLPKMPPKPSVVQKTATTDKPTLPPLPDKPVKKEEIKKETISFTPPPIPEEIELPVEKEKSSDELDEKIKKMQDNFEKLSNMMAEDNVEINDLVIEEIPEIVDYDEEAPDFKDMSDKPSEQQKRFISIEQGQNKDAVLSATMAEIRKISSRSLVMFIKYEDLIPVVGIGNGIINKMNDFKISLSEPSVFNTVYSTKKEYYGPMPKDQVSERFIYHFGNYRPQSVTIVPSMIDDQIFCLIYAEETSTIVDLKRIADAMSSAFNRLLGNV